MIDDYPTCEETYVTLRVYHDAADPAAVTARLGLEPSDFQCAGGTYERRGVTRTYPISGWFLCSEGKVDSYDSEKHLRWLLDQLGTRGAALDTLRAQGWTMDIACMWDSHAGHGGPTLSPELLRRLAETGIELWFDVYFHGSYDIIRKVKEAEAIPPKG
jgi:hypothetical protein